MKHTFFYNIYVWAVCLVLFALPAGAQHIRVVPQQVSVRNDSLQLLLDMDLEAVNVSASTAVIFTPQLLGPSKQLLSLPPVIISGGIRERQDRRERYLSAGKESSVPYLRIRDTRHTGSKKITYRMSVPYTSWMQQASLLLCQEVKDCCDLQLLGVDTLVRKLSLNHVPQPIGEAPVPVPDTGSQKKRPLSRANMTKNTKDRAVAPAIPHRVREQSVDVTAYESMVSYLHPETGRSGKRHTESAVLYFDYPIGKDDIYPDYKNNREEIDKIDRIMVPLQDNRFTSVERIRICGYSSPDGPYGDNERLAKARSGLFAYYLRNAYGIPRDLVEVSSVAEDWEGLSDLMRQEKPSWQDAVLRVIRRYGIFNGREKQLMDLEGGTPYREMMRRYFPKLRRIEVVVQYDVRKVEGDEAAELIYTHPDLLSLEEIYAVARYYRPGTEQYREVYEIAAFHFPDDVVANVNAASAVMLTGDLTSAWDYLRKVEADPRAWNNLGVLTLMEGDPSGAAVWFRKAVGVEPRKARKNLEIAESYLESDE